VNGTARNTGTIISFRVGMEDAEILAKEFYPVFAPVDLVSLPNHQIYLRLAHGFLWALLIAFATFGVIAICMWTLGFFAGLFWGIAVSLVGIWLHASPYSLTLAIHASSSTFSAGTDRVCWLGRNC